MFENLFNEIQEKHGKFTGIERQEIHFFDDPLMYPTLYKDKLKNINSMEQVELYTVVSASLPVILENIAIGKDDYDDIKYFQNKRFLDTVVNVCARQQQDIKVIRGLNKIAYQYLTSGLPDLPLKDDMVEVVKSANRNFMNTLMSMTGMNEDQALDITSAFFCTDNNLKAILKMNCVMVNLPTQLMTEQNIIFIYETFAEYLRMTNLFKSVMFDFGIDTSTKEQLENFSMMTVAVLNMLNSQSLEVIRLTLIEYSNTYNYPTPAANPVRFTIYSISQQDYDRILFVVDKLRGEDIIVP